MRKGFIIFCAVMAVVLAACGIHCANSVDVLELQWQGVSYYDALKVEADARITSYYLYFIGFLCGVAGYMVKKTA